MSACGGGDDGGGNDVDAAVAIDAAVDAATDANAAPAISSVTPSAGYYPGGLRLTIDGERLAGTTAVTVGGAACRDLALFSATRVQCTSPSGAVGPADVMLTAAAGDATATGAFTYRDFTTVTTIAGAATFGNADGTGDVATLSSAINGLFVEGDTLYIADGTNYRVRAMDLSSLSATAPAATQVTLSTVAGSGMMGAADSSDGTGATATFRQPDDVIVVGNELYVSDVDWFTPPYAARLRKVALATGATVSVGASTDSLAQVVWDGGNYLYVARCGSTIERVDLGAGGTSTVWAGSAEGDAIGALADARFACPYGLALSDDKSTLYVADYWNNKIKAIDIAGGTVSVLAGSGTDAHTDNVSGAAASFNEVCKLARGGKYLFVADLDNCALRRVDVETTAVSTIVGGTSACGHADGALAGAQIGYVNAVAYHPEFGLFVGGTDWGWRTQQPNGRIQLVH